MRKNRSNRRSHRRSRRHHSKTMKRNRRGGNANMASSLYKPVAAVAKEPVLMADKVGQNVSDTLKKAQVSLMRGQYKAKEQPVRQLTLSRGSVSGLVAPSSLYLAEAVSTDATLKGVGVRREGVCHSFCNE